MDKEWQGKGIITKACKILLEYIFENRNLNKAVICCNDDNIKSIEMARRLGFKKEGNLRDYFVVNKKRRNMMVWGLLRKEWELARSNF